MEVKTFNGSVLVRHSESELNSLQTTINMLLAMRNIEAYGKKGANEKFIEQLVKVSGELEDILDIIVVENAKFENEERKEFDAVEKDKEADLLAEARKLRDDVKLFGNEWDDKIDWEVSFDLVNLVEETTKDGENNGSAEDLVRILNRVIRKLSKNVKVLQ